MANKNDKNLNLSLEEFENGIKIFQDNTLYKFTSDSIRLAKFCNIKHTDRVLDMCAGCGVVGLYLYSITKFQNLYFNEIQPTMCELINKNLKYNQLEDKSKVLCKNLEDLTLDDFKKPVDVIVCNPPYYKLNGEIKERREIAICRHEICTNLTNIIKKSSSLLKNKGKFYIIVPEDRLCEVVFEMGNNNFKVKRIQFNAVKNKINTCLLEAVKCGKSGVKLSIIEE